MKDQKGNEKNNTLTRITAIICSIVMVSAAAFVIISGMGAKEVSAVTLPEPTLPPAPTATPETDPTNPDVKTAESAESELTDEEAALQGSTLDDTGLSLMTSFSFSEVDNPEKVVEEYVLIPGMHDEQVKDLKERLVSLDYLEADEPDDYYGEQTAYAMQLFQRTSGLPVTGAADKDSIELLTSERAPVYTVGIGINGTDVEEIQKRLKELGYLKVKVTGYYGADTKTAVEAFQKNNGLSIDGRVGVATREALYSTSAKKFQKETPSPSPTKTASPSPTKEKATREPEKSAEPSKQPDKSKDPEPSKEPDKTPEPEPSKEPDKTPEPEPSKEPEKTPEPAPSKDLGGSGPAPNQSKVEAFINYAMTLRGKKYVLGGKGPDVFDCSGFIYYALNKSGALSISYMTSGGWANSSFPTISKGNLKRGDIICYQGHVGIYLGGGDMLDASSSQGQIRVYYDIWSSPYWNSHFICGKRPLT